MIIGKPDKKDDEEEALALALAAAAAAALISTLSGDNQPSCIFLISSWVLIDESIKKDVKEASAAALAALNKRLCSISVSSSWKLIEYKFWDYFFFLILKCTEEINMY